MSSPRFLFAFLDEGNIQRIQCFLPRFLSHEYIFIVLLDSCWVDCWRVSVSGGHSSAILCRVVICGGDHIVLTCDLDEVDAALVFLCLSHRLMQPPYPPPPPLYRHLHLSSFPHFPTSLPPSVRPFTAAPCRKDVVGVVITQFSDLIRVLVGVSLHDTFHYRVPLLYLTWPRQGGVYPRGRVGAALWRGGAGDGRG